MSLIPDSLSVSLTSFSLSVSPILRVSPLPRLCTPSRSPLFAPVPLARASTIFHPLFRPSTLASIKWISQTKNSNKLVETGPLQDQRGSNGAFQRSRKQMASSTASPMATFFLSHPPNGAVLSDASRCIATRCEAKRSETVARVRSIGRGFSKE